MSGSACGLYRSENAGMSSAIYVRIIKAESLRFLEEDVYKRQQSDSVR